ncbi:MAG: hypothetical protein IJU69_00350 [Bacteroidales bacterium]|nr:hypothetical protein [Bacteroidales bacterium]
MLALSVLFFASCGKDGGFGSSAMVTFRKANISGASMLAHASGTLSCIGE